MILILVNRTPKLSLMSPGELSPARRIASSPARLAHYPPGPIFISSKIQFQRKLNLTRCVQNVAVTGEVAEILIL
jgi:hypothetical protein